MKQAVKEKSTAYSQSKGLNYIDTRGKTTKISKSAAPRDKKTSSTNAIMARPKEEWREPSQYIRAYRQ